MANTILLSVSQQNSSSGEGFIEDSFEFEGIGHPKIQSILQNANISFKGPSILRGRGDTTQIIVNSSDYAFAIDKILEQI